MGGIVVCVTLLMTLTGCGSDEAVKPDFLGLENSTVSEHTQKVPSDRFISTFQNICVQNAKTHQAIGPSLRALGYTAVPAKKANAPRFYIPKGKRPVILLATRQGKSGCAVAAISNSGHTFQAKKAILKAYPNAIPLNPRKLGKTIEEAWRIPSSPGTYIFMARDTPLGAPSTLTVGITQTR